MGYLIVYLWVALTGVLVGMIAGHTEKRLIEEKKIFTKDIIKEYKNNNLIIFTIAILYVALFYRFEFSLDFIKYATLVPMLIIALTIDYKLQIIPNRLNLTIFEVGLVFALIYGLINVNVAVDMLIGMVAGGGIFLIITLLGGLIARKEAMGFGDVKLMAGLGLFFGLRSVIMLSIISFLIGAILSIMLLLSKAKKSSEYIPFGPFIVLATIITIFIPSDILFVGLITVLSLGTNIRR